MYVYVCATADNLAPFKNLRKVWLFFGNIASFTYNLVSILKTLFYLNLCHSFGFPKRTNKSVHNRCFRYFNAGLLGAINIYFRRSLNKCLKSELI